MRNETGEKGQSFNNETDKSTYLRIHRAIHLTEQERKSPEVMKKVYAVSACLNTIDVFGEFSKNESISRKDFLSKKKFNKLESDNDNIIELFSYLHHFYDPNALMDNDKFFTHLQKAYTYLDALSGRGKGKESVFKKEIIDATNLASFNKIDGILSRIIHDLRNPITVYRCWMENNISSFRKFSGNRKKDEFEVRYLDQINNAKEKIRLFTANKAPDLVEKGFHMETFLSKELEGLIEANMQFGHKALREFLPDVDGDIQIVLDKFPPEIPFEVTNSKVLFEDFFSNIATNQAKSISARIRNDIKSGNSQYAKPEVRIGHTLETDANTGKSLLRLSFGDNGTGFPENFKGFKKGESQWANEDIKGTGRGMAENIEDLEVFGVKVTWEDFVDEGIKKGAKIIMYVPIKEKIPNPSVVNSLKLS